MHYAENFEFIFSRLRRHLNGAGSKFFFWDVSGFEDRGGGDNSIQFINIGGGVTKVLKNCDEK